MKALRCRIFGHRVLNFVGMTRGGRLVPLSGVCLRCGQQF
jgi:hypothetical protein